MKTQIKFKDYVEILNAIRYLDDFKANANVAALEFEKVERNPIYSSRTEKPTLEQLEAYINASKMKERTMRRYRRESETFMKEYSDILGKEWENIPATAYWQFKAQDLCKGCYEIVR